MRHTKLLTTAVIVVAAATLSACGTTTSTTSSAGGGATSTTSAPTSTAAPTSSTAAPSSSAPAALTTIIVGATAVPHAQILQFVQDNLAAAAGLKLDIKEYNDYVLPNKALADGSLDANYFQHIPYLTAQEAEFKYDFFAYPGIHIEPIGIYSKKVTSLDAVPAKGVVGVPNDPANQGRALKLLASKGLITLANTGDKDPTLLDIATNPKNLTFKEIAAEQLAYSLQDLDLAVINGNFAIQAGLKPSTDALALESGENNPYANVLVVRSVDKDKPELVKLNELLHSDAVKKYITDTWPDGAVIPAF